MTEQNRNLSKDAMDAHIYSSHEDQNSKAQRSRRLNRLAALSISGVLLGAGAFGFDLLQNKSANGENKSPSQNSGLEVNTTNLHLSTPEPMPADPTASPSSSLEASPSVSPEASQEAQAFQGITIPLGGVIEVQPGDIISGDVSMSDIKVDPTDLEAVKANVRPLYDQDQNKKDGVTDTANTALFVVVKKAGYAYGDNGGFIARGLKGTDATAYLTLQRNAKIRSGFQSADVVVWTGNATTADEAGNLPNGQVAPASVIESNPYNNLPIDGTTTDISAQEATRLIDIIESSPNYDPNDPLTQETIAAALRCILCTECQSPEPSANPSPTPTPTPSGEVCEPWTDKILSKGDKKTYTVYGFASLGDDILKIDGGRRIVAHDNLPGTAAVDAKWFGTPTQVTVWSPYGGTDFQVFNSCATEQDWASKVADDILQTKKHASLDKKSYIDKNRFF